MEPELYQVSLDPKELQNLLDELKASRASRKTAWNILQELRGILNEHGVSLAPPAVKNIGVEGRLVRDGVRKALANRRRVIQDLVKAIGEYRKSCGDHQTVHALNKALERRMVIRRSGEGTVSGRSNDGLADQSASKQSEER